MRIEVPGAGGYDYNEVACPDPGTRARWARAIALLEEIGQERGRTASGLAARAVRPADADATVGASATTSIPPQVRNNNVSGCSPSARTAT